MVVNICRVLSCFFTIKISVGWSDLEGGIGKSADSMQMKIVNPPCGLHCSVIQSCAYLYSHRNSLLGAGVSLKAGVQISSLQNVSINILVVFMELNSFKTID